MKRGCLDELDGQCGGHSLLTRFSEHYLIDKAQRSRKRQVKDKDNEKGGTSTQMILVVGRGSDRKLFRGARDDILSRQSLFSVFA